MNYGEGLDAISAAEIVTQIVKEMEEKGMTPGRSGNCGNAPHGDDNGASRRGEEALSGNPGNDRGSAEVW